MLYKITFHTGMIRGSGTDADVSIQIFGSKASTKEIQLKSKISDFEKGNIDKFFFETNDLGRLEKIKLWHNNKNFGADWFLNYVTIESSDEKAFGYFPVNKWISKKVALTVSSVPSSTYNFELVIGTLPGSGSKDDLQVSLIGSKKYTPFILLNNFVKNGEFKTGHTESFSFIAEDVGKLEEIKVKAIPSNFNSNLFLARIKITKNSKGQVYNFPFECWIKSGKIYSSNTKLIEYTIKIFTGDVAYGGTDANVSMVVKGTRGETDEIKLNELIARNAFEAGQIDYVKIANPNLGKINKIKIWHDEKWPGDGWFLNKVLIKNDSTGTEAEFPYYSWLDKSADPSSVKIELTRIPVQPRPFYAIAHMVNTPAYAEEALDLGSNAIEIDITPTLDKNNNFSFDVFHGFRPDFDPDKINLMERSLAKTELPLFLENLKFLEKKFPKFTLVIFDCKIEKIHKNKLGLCGKQLAENIMNYFYNVTDSKRLFSIISIGKKKSATFLNGFIEHIPKEFLPYIGFDLSMESFQKTEKYFENLKGTNYWWGSGIASTVPKSLKHFLPQFLVAAKKRTKQGVIKKIYYWTLDDPDSMARILVTKLDGIIVNDPLKLIKVLEKEEFKHTYKLASRNDNPFSIF